MKLQQEGVGIKMDSVLPHLVLVDDDLLSTGIVVYHLKVVLHHFLVKIFVTSFRYKISIRLTLTPPPPPSQLKRLLIIKQILLSSTLRNVWRRVWRMWKG